MVELESLATQLDRVRKEESNFVFDINPIPGDVEVLQIIIEDREELPIFLSVSDEQILCIAYLFKVDEVRKEMIANMNSAMLTASISIPLSSFAKIDDQYVLFGALSVHSSINEIVHELNVLSDNTIEAIEAMRNYLS